MRRAAKSDANQPQIVKVLRQLGFFVAHTHTVGKGFPDLVLGKSGVTVLAEVKDPAKPPSERRLTAPEQKFFDEFTGYAVILETTADCVALAQELSHG